MPIQSLLQALQRVCYGPGYTVESVVMYIHRGQSLASLGDLSCAMWDMLALYMCSRHAVKVPNKVVAVFFAHLVHILQTLWCICSWRQSRMTEL